MPLENIRKWGGVLFNSIFKAFSDFTSHLFGGDVDETETERTPHQNACALYCNILKWCAFNGQPPYTHRTGERSKHGTSNDKLSKWNILTSVLGYPLLWSRWFRRIRYNEHIVANEHRSNSLSIKFSRGFNACKRHNIRFGITPERGWAV